MITFPLFKNTPNTIAPTETHSRLEGFLNGFHPHTSGTGITMFMSDTRGENNEVNILAVNVWGKDASWVRGEIAIKQAEKLLERQYSLFISVDAQWQGKEYATGEKNGEYDVMNSRMGYNGRNIIQVNPRKTGDAPRGIIHKVNSYTNGLPLYENIPDTLAPAEWFHRIEGFLSGYAPHSVGDGGTMFLNDIRPTKNSKDKHVARVNVWGDDALMARDAAEHLRKMKAQGTPESVFFSVNARWQAPETGTGIMVGEFEKKTSTMSFIGKEIVQLNPKFTGDYPRSVTRTCEVYADWLRSQGTYPEQAS